MTTNPVQIERKPTEHELREMEREYCSYGDTVHYLEPPKFFERAEENYLIDREGVAFLDLQMWYSAASFGYGNLRLNNRAEAPDRSPSATGVAVSPYRKGRTGGRHREAERIEIRTQGPRSFQRRRIAGDRGQLETRAQRNRQEPYVRVQGRLPRPHAGCFGDHLQLSLPPPLRPLFRSRTFRAVSVSFPLSLRQKARLVRDVLRRSVREEFRYRIQRSLGPEGQESEFAAFYVEAIQGTGGYIVPPPGYFNALKQVLDERNILMVDDEIQMGFYRTGKFWAIEHFDV